MRLRLCTALWAASVFAGLLGIFLYSAHPGRASEPPPVWPDGELALAHQRPTLVLSIHPRCSCTRATLAELSRLLAQVGPGRVLVHALIVVPSREGEHWADTDLRERAESCADTIVHLDVDGRTSAAFGMYTSGAVAMYDVHGALAFHGGLTPTRGHEGDSVGKARLIALIEGGSPQRRESAVYGCELGELGR